ncbi:partial HTH-type transcriptional regulator MalT, partial [Gammaproteobacteria bacterium]
HERAVQLIEPLARELLGRNEAATLHRWLTALPVSLVQARISLRLKLAWAQALTARFSEATDTLDALDIALNDSPALEPGLTPDAVRGELCAIRATIAIRRGEWTEASNLLHAAWELVPAETAMLRGVVAAQRGIAALFQGDLITAAPWFEQAIELSQASHNPRTALTSFNNLGASQALRGQLHATADTYRRALAYADQHVTTLDRQPRAMTNMLHIGLGETLYEWNELDAAEIEVRQGWCASDDQACDEQAQLAGYLMLARLRQARGDLDRAIAVLDDGEKFGERCASHWAILCDVRTLRARYQLQQGDVAAVVRWVTSIGLALDAPAAELCAQASAYLVRARLLITQRDPQALDLLARLSAALEISQHRGVQIEAQVVLAQAQQQHGQTTAALNTLQHVLELAAPELYTRVFLDEAHVRPLLIELRWQLRSSGESLVINQIDRLLAAMGVATIAPQSAGVIPGALLEPLNERELDVLRLIADGRSNHDIAQELIVAVSTVKWHINNLYAKLDVHSRTLAIARARELGLLQTMYSVGSYQSRTL